LLAGAIASKSARACFSTSAASKTSITTHVLWTIAWRD
jgi:hypothetical protein